MMRLCPIRYGGTISAPSSSWLLSSYDGLRVGSFNGTSWQTLTAETDYAGHLLTYGDYVYFKKGGTGNMRYALLSDLTSWTLMGNVSSDTVSGQLATDGTYVYSATGNQGFVRALHPTGSATNYGAGSFARFIVYDGTNLFGAYTTVINKSTNQGLTYSQVVSNTWLSGIYGESYIVKNDTGRIVILANSGANKVVARYTDDGFTSLSSEVLVEASVTSQGCSYRGMVWDGTYFVAILRNGNCYRSTDGTSWAKSTIASTDLNSIGVGGGRLLAVDQSSNIFYSDDHGATWGAFPAPDSGNPYSDIIYLP
jgi:hypothetical protein